MGVLPFTVLLVVFILSVHTTSTTGWGAQEAEEPIPYDAKEKYAEENEFSIVDKPALLQFVAKRLEDTFVPVKDENVEVMEETKVGQIFLNHLDTNKTIQIIEKILPIEKITPKEKISPIVKISPVIENKSRALEEKKDKEIPSQSNDEKNSMDISNKKLDITNSIFEAFTKVPNEVKLNIFKEFQSQFISTLDQMLDDGLIELVTESELDQLRLFDSIVIDAMKRLISGEELDETTKRLLKTFQERLILVVNKIIEETKEVSGITNLLKNFKKIHTYQIVSLIFRMNNEDLLGVNQMLQLMKTEKELIDDLKKLASESLSEREKEFYKLPDDKKILEFKKYQSEFISTLEKMLEDERISGISKAHLSKLRDFENTAADALSKQLSGEDLSTETKKKLKVYEGELITAINDLEEVLGTQAIKQDLEELKKHHAYFIVAILYGLNSGTKISSRQVRKLLNLMAIEEYLLQDIIKIQVTSSPLKINPMDDFTEIEDDNTEGNKNKAVCERLIPMLLELQTKQEEIRKMISAHLKSKEKLQY